MLVGKGLAALGLAVVCATGAVGLGDVERAEAADARPSVVVVYLDDINPGTHRLWSDRERTPALARFRTRGVEFRNAVASTPLCGPSRASLLTGQYGHRHGVTGNGLVNFDPASTLATELRDSGYHTIMAGKYGNGIERLAPTTDSVAPYAAGWSEFDIIWRRQFKGHGQFYSYDLWTKDGVLRKGAQPKDHSTWVVGKRIASRILQAPADKPLFALASFSAGHVPNLPLAWHVGSRLCRRIEAYRSPSFNEKNVSDKPAYIRSLPRLADKSFPLRSRCEEMLGVEAAVVKIRQALQVTGRLDNTLLILTADNGYLLGDHRMPGRGGKRWPHAVPVPLYALWPAELRNRRRVVQEPVSNVDLPVTICRLAGCDLDDADGINILPLLRGNSRELDRRFVYQEMLHDRRGMPPWYGLITTRRFSSSATYQYVEYATGARELYNLTGDPYRLRNLARKPRQAWRVDRLHRMLHNRVVKPDAVRLR
jgi:N-acetylglucosamine-6-sulfatase